MIYTTEESRGGLSAEQFERKIAEATSAVWATIGSLFQQSFRAAHVVHAPARNSRYR